MMRMSIRTTGTRNFLPLWMATVSWTVAVLCMMSSMDFSHAMFIGSDADYSGSYFSCPGCGLRADEETQSRLLDKENITCRQCGRRFHILTATMSLQHEFEGMFHDPKSAVDRLWYHVSVKSLDEMDFTSDREMHVGQMGSIEQYVSEHPRFDGEDTYLYTLQFRPGTLLYGKVIDDQDDWVWAEHLFRGMSEDALDVDGFVYLNRFEDPGSLSVVARRCVFDVLTVSNLV